MRKSDIKRKTGETDIEVSLTIDGEGKYEVDTEIGFFDHMLTLMCRHSLMDMKIKAKGDLYIDGHHTVEDVGITLGMALKEALGDKSGIKRYGTSYVPMDEALALVSLDLSGRDYLVFDAPIDTSKTLGNFDVELTEEFFRAVATNCGITLHCKVLYGKNNHHMIEALFKAFGRALREATSYDEKIKGVMSTKGVL
ncbi:imidazoleglycerol-phosphate dehydratase HisB [Clostridium fungisolvens]|uniref:Imidazoleglycerol-phosphate dehydratase n=1 Tax=Clostridium fungisolvens TaxID=1604897 RepID=A0A6V8SGM0_9CLOT|nr:imidazoleglycerol-phosphate dehydratase HisB [Clostridium fungisolvens]GFP74023.1 Imidazoleglycerol-phosphate dehydratase [Clostridium fungisolvens]